MSYLISKIAEIIHAKYLQKREDSLIENLITDSRKLLFPQTTVFFSLTGYGRSGNTFIKSLYEKGLRNFIVENTFSASEMEVCKDANFLQVDNGMVALQNLAKYHRHQFHFPVIGLTGSNGKTIVKEWLYQLLSDDYNIVRSPKSYNSQVGVPLSVWRMNERNTLGIFESGISQINEMENLQKIIDPEIGIITSIGSAHNEGFVNMEEKINEKLLLFKNSNTIIYCKDEPLLTSAIDTFIKAKNNQLTPFTWSKKTAADLFIKRVDKNDETTEISCAFKNHNFSYIIPFTDEASINNTITCCCTLLALKIEPNVIAERMLHIRPLAMRLELKQGINNCSIINDAYSADLQSLSISLDFLDQQRQHEKRTVILSDFLQSGNNIKTLYDNIATALTNKNIQHFIGIGPEISLHASSFSFIKQTNFYPSTEAFLQTISDHHFKDEIILLKAARVFQFEKISAVLEKKAHETILEINLNALRHNLKVYKQLLQPNVKVMAMVKAFSYGSGSFEIANVLQHVGVDYLAVAYTDEGVDLRKAGITLPIMVMNPEDSGFENIINYNLEPEIFSFTILHAFIDYLKNKKLKDFPIHIKIDTGMHRLGFEENEMNDLGKILLDNNAILVKSVFSHLAGSDGAMHDTFTNHQTDLFLKASGYIEQTIGYSFIKHISNSSAIYRFPQLQMDMVRLGIGLYGLDSSPFIQNRLQPVATLKTTISQIKHIKKGESIGYSRKGIAQQDTRTATVRIGYADGYPRILSNGKGKMFIDGNPAPVIGNICMDMTMLDITGIEAKEGDEVVVFGEEPTVTNIANWADTISYEILTNISQRVKRVYYEE